MDMLVIFAAKYLMFVIALAVAAYALLSPRVDKPQFAALALAALPLAYALARLAGLFVSHVQPFAAEGFEPLLPHEVDNSFPSDHSALAGAMATVVALYSARLGALLWVLALCVGAARVLAGLHYATDVVAGLVLGAAAAYISFWLVHLYFSARKRY